MSHHKTGASKCLTEAVTTGSLVVGLMEMDEPVFESSLVLGFGNLVRAWQVVVTFVELPRLSTRPNNKHILLVRMWLITCKFKATVVSEEEIGASN